MTLCSDWITSADLVDCDCLDAATPSIIATALTSASDIMYNLSGRQHPGVCTETLRPCADGGAIRPIAWPYPWIPWRVDGQWLNLGGCGCHRTYDCGCNPLPQLNLGRADIQTVTQVLIDGVALPQSAYRLDHNRWLIRVDGNGWPCCQNLTLPDSQPDTWSVTVTYGTPIPESLQKAAAELAAELIKSCTGQDCRLPQRVQTVTRQGISMALLDPLDFLEGGRTGLYYVDLALAAYNPHRLRRRASVWSPELSGRQRRI